MPDSIPSSISSSSFPSDVLKWIKINSVLSPKTSLKFMKCCKYFQHPEFPYFVAKSVHFYIDKWFITALDGRPNIYTDFEGIENINKKFWVIENIYFSITSNVASFFSQKIAVCDISQLTLDYQELSFIEFKFLIGFRNVKMLDLYDTKITFENGEQIFINDILKCVPNVENFTYWNEQSSILPANFVEIYKEINASKIEKITIDLFSYSDFEAFLKFSNHNPHIRYHLQLIQISDEETQALRNYINEMIDAGPTKFPPLFIEFPEQNLQELSALYLLHDRYYEQKNNE